MRSAYCASVLSIFLPYREEKVDEYSNLTSFADTYSYKADQALRRSSTPERPYSGAAYTSQHTTTLYLSPPHLMNLTLVVTLSPEGATRSRPGTHRRSRSSQEGTQNQDTPRGGREGVNRFTDCRYWERDASSTGRQQRSLSFQGGAGNRDIKGRSVNRFQDHRNCNGELLRGREGASSSIGKHSCSFQGGAGNRDTWKRGESRFTDHRNWNGELQGRGAMRGGGHRCRSEAYDRRVERRAGVGRTSTTTPPSSGNIGGRGRGERGERGQQHKHITAVVGRHRYNRYFPENLASENIKIKRIKVHRLSLQSPRDMEVYEGWLNEVA